MSCEDPDCVAKLSWFRAHVLNRPGYYLEEGWYCSEVCLEKGIARRLEKRGNSKEKAVAASFRSRMEQVLIGNGAITRDHLDKALAEPSWNSDRKLSDHLLALGLVKERDVTLARSQLFSLPVINLTSHTINPAVLNMIPLAIVRDHRFFPLDFDPVERRLVLVTYDPADLAAMVNLRGILDCQVEIYLGDESAVRGMIDVYCSLSEQLNTREEIESPGVVRDRRDLARWIVGRAKTMEARSLRIDCFDRFIWTRFVVDHKPLDFVLIPTYAN